MPLLRSARVDAISSVKAPLLAPAFLFGLLIEVTAAEGRWERTVNNGCLVWNPLPQPEETVTWSGACPGGKAIGPGTEIFYGRAGGVRKEERYEGAMHEGKLSGHGTLYYDTGDIFEGEFADGKRVDGEGSFTYRSGEQYRGMFVGDKFQGHGIFTFANGNRYEGQFEGGLPNGPGRFVAVSGDSISGNWKNGCIRQGAHVAAVGVSKEACGFK